VRPTHPASQCDLPIRWLAIELVGGISVLREYHTLYRAIMVSGRTPDDDHIVVLH